MIGNIARMGAPGNSGNAGRAAGLLWVMVLAACDRTPKKPTLPAVAEVRVTPDSVTLVAGKGIQLAAEVDDATGQPIGGASIAFASTDTSKLVVSPTGFLQSQGPAGQAQVVVSSGGKQTRVSAKITAGPARTIASVHGDGQSGIVGAALPQPLVVRVFDGEKNPVAGSDVAFVPVDGGIADPGEAATNTGGETSSHWTLGPVAGTQILIASIKGKKSSTATFSAHAQSGPPAKLVGRSIPLGAGGGGDDRTLEVSVTDADGNAKPGVTVHWRISAGRGKLSSESTTSDESGIARVVLSPSTKARLPRVTASVGDLVARIDVGAK